MKTIINKQFTLQGRDFVRGLLIAVLTAVLTVFADSIQDGVLNFNWQLIGTTAVSAGIAYLLKNFGEPTKVVTVKEGEEAKRIVELRKS